MLGDNQDYMPPQEYGRADLSSIFLLISFIEVLCICIVIGIIAAGAWA